MFFFSFDLLKVVQANKDANGNGNNNNNHNDNDNDNNKNNNKYKYNSVLISRKTDNLLVAGWLSFPIEFLFLSLSHSLTVVLQRANFFFFQFGLSKDFF